MKPQDRKDYFTIMVIVMVLSLGLNVGLWNTVQKLRTTVTAACDQGIIAGSDCDIVR